MTLDALNTLLRRDAKSFAKELSKLAYERGLAVTNNDGTTRAIPVTATAVVREGQELKRRAALSALLSSATFKMSRSVLAGEAKQLLLSALSPLERKLAEATYARVTHLATTRVDYFEHDDKPWALEVNATIPAMQGYSDLAAQTFIEVVGRFAGIHDHEIAALQARNGSNALALYRALIDGYAKERGGKTPSRMVLLCRRHDAQLTEQRYLAARFSEFGTDAEVVHPDELSGDKPVLAKGKPVDLIYRHLFVRRLEETPNPYVIDLLAQIPSQRVVILNGPASQVEVKASFALLSQAAVEPDLARAALLTEEELVAIRTSVPWTRPLRRAPSLDPDGKQVEDLVDRVSTEPARFVLKRSWDYGGRAVFVGRAVKEPSFDERVRAAYGTSLSWKDLVVRASEDRVGGGFVVQEIIPSAAQPHVLCVDGGVKDVELYVDFSAYASVGLDHAPAWGGVCRGSISQIVNIVGGGGVLPLLTAEVAEALRAGLAQR